MGFAATIAVHQILLSVKECISQNHEITIMHEQMEKEGLDCAGKKK